jgi:hypothetical protein
MRASFSDDAEQKLHALVALDGRHPNIAMPPRYIEACRSWRDALSEEHKLNAAAAMRAFQTGAYTTALETVALLPPVPCFP